MDDMESDFGVRDALACLGRGLDLTADQTRLAVGEIMRGEVPEGLIAAFLTGLRVKGETPEELAGAVRAALEGMTGALVPSLGGPLLDTCGTGGDGARTLNISTGVAFVAAASGVAVAKHGNRSASGNSGSAEVLSALGANPDLEPTAAGRLLSELGLTYFFAPRYHPGFRHAASARRLLPFRTLFNLVGPLANPARPSHQLLGVPDEDLAELLARGLLELGVERAAVVTGGDGLDEVTLDGPTWVRVVDGPGGSYEHHTWHAADFDLPRVTASELRVAGPEESASRLLGILRGGLEDPGRHVILANAAAALWIAGRAESLAEGAAVGAEAIDSGRALGLLERWRALAPVGVG